MKNNQLTAALLAVLLFAGGVVVGVLGERYYSHSTVHARPSAETLRDRYINEAKSRVHLTGDQVKQLNTILDGTRAKLRTFRQSHHAEFEKINQEQIQQVKAILRPDQVAAYDQLVADQDRRWHRDHHD
jgi:superfamily I DNA and RNA helicase